MREFLVYFISLYYQTRVYNNAYERLHILQDKNLYDFFNYNYIFV